MNPYLEQPDAWHDFHEAFCPACREVLVPQVHPDYIVKLDEHVYIHELPAEERRLLGRADLSVAEATTHAPAQHQTQLLEAPAYGRLLPSVDIERLNYVEIRDRKSRKLITVIELLSPSNKAPGGDRDQYVSKRWHLIYSGVNFVEIDLLRGGTRPPVEDLPECDYYVMVARPEQWPRVGLWPFRLRDPLPKIPIPLRAPDHDAELELKPLLDRIYDASGYEHYIYAEVPEPSLTPDDGTWAKDLLSSHGVPVSEHRE
jgi:hypothetical protein